MEAMFLRNVIIRLEDYMVLPFSVLQTSILNKQWNPEMSENSRHMFAG
jgi:hypothetical protein